jgi:hypothetical protein
MNAWHKINEQAHANRTDKRNEDKPVRTGSAIFICYDASSAFSMRNASQRGTGKVPVKQRTRYI